MIDVAVLTRAFLTTVVAAPATGTLQAGINATDTTITLGAGEGAAFPANQNFVIKIGSELMHVNRAVDTLTVRPGPGGSCRGSFGTTAAAHLAAVTVSQANLYLTVGTNVVWPQLPAEYDNEEPCVMFYRRGGRNEGTAELHSPSWTFRCFGGSLNPMDSMAVYRMLHDRLQNKHGVNTGNGRVISAYEEGIGQLIYDPDTKPAWPTTVAFFVVKCKEQ